MDVTITCPYCNSKEVPDMLSEPGYITKCCNRVVAVSHWPSAKTALYIPSKQRAQGFNLIGDVSPVKESPDNNRPNSSFTMVFASGAFYCVRLIPKFMNLDALGRPWGLAFGQEFTSVHEAHLFADSIDHFLTVMIGNFKRDKIRDLKIANAEKVKPKYPPRGR